MGQQQSSTISFSKLDIIQSLKDHILHIDDPLWEQLFDSGLNSNLLTQFTFEDIHSILSVQPVNIATMLFQLLNSIHDHSSTFIAPNEITKYLRFFTWIIPSILSYDNSDLINKLLFTPGPLNTSDLLTGIHKIVHPPPSESPSSDLQLLRSKSSENTILKFRKAKETDSFASSMVYTLSRLLFLPLFTIPDNTNDKNKIWTNGIGCKSSKKVSNEIIINRIDTLRAIIACTCKPIYEKEKDSVQSTPIHNQWLSLFIDKSINENSWDIFCSLLNISLTYDPIGWGVPYNYLLSSNDNTEILSEISLQTLIILLNRHELSNLNIFQGYLKSLGNESASLEFSFLYNNICHLLLNPLKTKNTYLPNSGKGIQSYQEILMLFWILISLNKDFKSYILHKEDITIITGALLTYIVENRNHNAVHDFVLLSIFTLLMLSGERKFGVQLNKNFIKQYTTPSISSFNGSYNDFLIITIHKILSDSNPRLYGMFETILTILANISPYITHLSMTSSMKLAKLFQVYASPKNLLSNKNCHVYVQYLLEVFNNIIQYQYAGNTAIVYSVVHHHQIFKNLTNLRIRSTKEDNEEKKHEETNENTNYWIPTNEWLQEWKSQLPLSTTIRLINAVLPDILQLSAENKSNTESIILEYLKTPLVGLLPVPHPILSRMYEENSATNLWFQRYMWFVIILRNRSVPFFGPLESIPILKKLPRN